MLYCFQEKGTGALLISGKENWSTTVLKEKDTGALMFSGEENRCSTVLGTRALGL